jgi:hypothetical protein
MPARHHRNRRAGLQRLRHDLPFERSGPGAPARSFLCRRLTALAHLSPALSIVSIIVIVDTIDPDQRIKPIILCGPSPRQTAVTPRLRWSYQASRRTSRLLRSVARFQRALRRSAVLPLHRQGPAMVSVFAREADAEGSSLRSRPYRCKPSFTIMISRDGSSLDARPSSAILPRTSAGLRHRWIAISCIGNSRVSM